MGFSGGSGVKNSPANAGNTGEVGSIPGSGRSSGEENGNLLWNSFLGSPMNRRAWWATIHGGHKESDATEHACIMQLTEKERRKEEEERREGRKKLLRKLTSNKINVWRRKT